HGTHREAAPQGGRLYSRRNGQARGGVVDFAGRGATLRDCDGERAGAKEDGPGELAVANQEDSHSRGRPLEAAPFNSLLSAAQGCGSLFGGVRRVPCQERLICRWCSLNPHTLLSQWRRGNLLR